MRLYYVLENGEKKLITKEDIRAYLETDIPVYMSLNHIKKGEFVPTYFYVKIIDKYLIKKKLLKGFKPTFIIENDKAFYVLFKIKDEVEDYDIVSLELGKMYGSISGKLNSLIPYPDGVFNKIVYCNRIAYLEREFKAIIEINKRRMRYERTYFI